MRATTSKPPPGGKPTSTFTGFAGDELRWHWRMATRPERTADELALLFGGFLELEGLTFAREITGGQGLAFPASRLRVLLERFRADRVPIADPVAGDPSAVAARSSACP